MPWSLIDFQVSRLPAVQGVDGTPMKVVFPVVPLDQLWRVEGIVAVLLRAPISASNTTFIIPTPPRIALYDQDPQPAAVPVGLTELSDMPWPFGATSGSPMPANGRVLFGSADDQASPLTIRGGSQLTVIFTLDWPGSVAGVRLQYQVWEGTPQTSTPITGKAIPAGSPGVGI